MDKRIFMLLGAVIVIGGVIFLLQRMMHQSTDCVGVSMNISSEKIIKGDSLLYEDNTDGAKKWSWNFGDKTGHSEKQKGSYMFTTEGSFWVKLLVNDKRECSDSVLVTVYVPTRDTISKTLITIAGPSTVNVGDKVQFKGEAAGASKWMWQFGESGKVDAQTQNPYYTYQFQGTYTIKLSTDNSKYPATKEIKVVPKRVAAIPVTTDKKKETGPVKPPPPPPSAKLPPPPGKKDIFKMLEMMAKNGGWNQQQKDWFRSKMVNGLSTPVTWNIPDVTVATIQDVNMEFISNADSYVIVDAVPEIDPAFNLISSLKIIAKKK